MRILRTKIFLGSTTEEINTKLYKSRNVYQLIFIIIKEEK